MPFDVATETPAIRRARLIEALRREMPPNHTWRFSAVFHKNGCGTVGCAIGVGILIGLPIGEDDGATGSVKLEELAEVFGITAFDANRIFLSTEAYGACAHCDVTPAMVADALERAT